MDMVSLTFDIIDTLIDRVPLIGSFKKNIEKNSSPRRLSCREVNSEKWLKKIQNYLNNSFKDTVYSEPYSIEILRDWLDVFADVFIVIIKRKLISWPLNSEQIIATIKILPLSESIEIEENFDPLIIKGKDLVQQLNKSKSIWIGDLTSSNNDLWAMFLCVKNKLENLNKPIYFRTANKKLRTIMFERYGAKVVYPSERDADGYTILVIQPII